MTLAIRNTTTSASAAGDTHTITKPTGVVAGDLLLLHIGILQTGALVSAPSGFTLVRALEGAGGADNTSIFVYAKTAGASEPADYTVTMTGTPSSTLGMIAWYSTVGKLVEVHASASQTNLATADVTFPSVTTTVANTALNCFATMSTNLSSTPDAAMTERWDIGSSPRNYLMTQAIAGTGATGTRTAVSASTQARQRCVTIALAEVEPTYTNYRVAVGHDIAAASLVVIDPQPTGYGIRPVAREYADGGLVDVAFYAILEWNTLGDAEQYQDLLTQFDLLDNTTADVTVYLRDHLFQFGRWNGTAVQPQLGVDGSWDNYFPRGTRIFIHGLVEAT